MVIFYTCNYIRIYVQQKQKYTATDSTLAHNYADSREKATRASNITLLIVLLVWLAVAGCIGWIVYTAIQRGNAVQRQNTQ